MIKETITEGASVAEALDCALEELGVQQDAVDYEVLEEGGRKLFGLGGERTARVRVWLKPTFLAELEKAEESKSRLSVMDEENPLCPETVEFVPKLSEEQLDNVADHATNALQHILAGFGIEANIDEYEGDEGEIILDIVGEDLGVLIGRHGKTLDAIQVLVSALTNKALGFRYPVLVDVAGYRNRRKAKLEEIGRRAAQRVAQYGQPVKLRPMSSYERKMIHVCLRKDGRVTTTSEGEEPFRQVVVLPK